MVYRDDEHILREGIVALQERLGLIDSIRFLELVLHRSGDYTKNREAFVDRAALDAHVAEFLSNVEVGPPPRTGAPGRIPADSDASLTMDSRRLAQDLI